MNRTTSRMTAVLLAAAFLGALGSALPSQAAPVIQPGVPLEFGSASLCTMNWVYNGPNGAVYVGAAAHCTTGKGQVVYLVAGDPTFPFAKTIERIGVVAYASPAASNGVSTGAPPLDYCLIRLDAGVLSQVKAWMVGHPGIPKGVSSTTSAKRGDLIQFSGHGVGFDVRPETQQSREGVLNYLDQGWQYVVGPISPGDSGGPVADLTDGNKALGIVSDVGFSFSVAAKGANVGESGATLAAILADAAKHGFSIRLRTA